MKGKRPAFLWYPGDWLRDPALRSVSFAARGLWIDMISIMFECPRKGVLSLNGKPVTAPQLARMTGGLPQEVSEILTELESAGVFSRREDGTIFCRRMIRDERKRLLCSDAGKRGGNPTLMGRDKGTVKGGDKGGDNLFPENGSKGQDKRNLTPSFSSSSSSSVSTSVKDYPVPEKIDTPEFRKAWGDWIAYRAERKKKLTPRMAGEQLAFLCSFSPEQAIEIIKRSIRNGWQGLFEPPADKSSVRPSSGVQERREEILGRMDI